MMDPRKQFRFLPCIGPGSCAGLCLDQGGQRTRLWGGHGLKLPMILVLHNLLTYCLSYMVVGSPTLHSWVSMGVIRSKATAKLYCVPVLAFLIYV